MVSQAFQRDLNKAFLTLGTFRGRLFTELVRLPFLSPLRIALEEIDSLAGELEEQIPKQVEPPLALLGDISVRLQAEVTKLALWDPVRKALEEMEGQQLMRLPEQLERRSRRIRAIL